MPKGKRIPHEERVEDMRMEKVADLAAKAAVRLFLEGKKPAPLEVWRIIRLPDDSFAVPRSVKATMESPTFHKLLNLRLRRATLTGVEDVLFLKELARDISQLAGDALLEDLLVRPESVSATEKRHIAAEFHGIYQDLTAPKPGTPALPEATEPSEVMIEQASSMEEQLQRLPKSLRERAVRQWKMDELKDIEQKERKLLGLGPTTAEASD